MAKNHLNNRGLFFPVFPLFLPAPAGSVRAWHFAVRAATKWFLYLTCSASTLALIAGAPPLPRVEEIKFHGSSGHPFFGVFSVRVQR